MATGLVSTSPETGLGTDRVPSGGRMNRPGCPVDDRRGDGPARPDPGTRHPDPQAANRYRHWADTTAAAASIRAITDPAAAAVTVASWPVPARLAGSRPGRSAAPGPLTSSRHQAGADRARSSRRRGGSGALPGELLPGASRQYGDLTVPVPVRACPALW